MIVLNYVDTIYFVKLQNRYLNYLLLILCMIVSFQ